MRNILIDKIRKFYKEDRFNLVDKDFLSFEEDMAQEKDLEKIESLLDEAVDKIYNSESWQPIENPNNSIILYITGLSDEFNFQKERCNHSKGTPPDVDTDAQPSRRIEIEEYLIKIYGEECIVHIGSYGTFGLKVIAQDLLRIHQPMEPKKKSFEDEKDYEKAFKKYDTELNKVRKYYNKISDKIPEPIHGKAPDLDKLKEAIPDVETVYPDYYSFAKHAYDMRKQLGVHAAGIIISNEPVENFIPTYKNTNKEENKQYDRITQFDKDEVEALGALKVDLLVTDNLDTIAETIKLLKQRDIVVDLNNDIYENPTYQPAYDILNKGLLAGIFQFETSGMVKKIIQDVQPSTMEDLSAINALNRPGPLDNGLVDIYIENKKAGTKPEDMPDSLAEILKSTNYCMIYQEQIMAAMTAMAGFTLREADDIRKALGKKKPEILEPYRAKFIQGCIDLNTCDEVYANNFWTGLEKFADYCFNLSHAILYSFLSYACAYLKAKYPAEFFAGYLTTKSRKSPETFHEKLKDINQECKKLGIELQQPDINKSGVNFIVKDGNILFSITGVKTVAGNSVIEIVESRPKDGYKDILHFLENVNKSKINIGKFEALVNAGAFDKMGYRREDLLENKEKLYGYFSDLRAYKQRIIDIEKRNKQRQEAELNKTKKMPELKMFEKPVKPEIERYKKLSISKEQLFSQAECTGVFFGRHPAELVDGNFTNITDLWIGNPANIVGLVVSVKEIATKKGDKMAFLKLEDGSGICEATVFPATWAKLKEPLEINSLIKAKVKVESEDPNIKVIINYMEKI